MPERSALVANKSSIADNAFWHYSLTRCFHPIRSRTCNFLRNYAYHGNDYCHCRVYSVLLHKVETWTCSSLLADCMPARFLACTYMSFEHLFYQQITPLGAVLTGNLLYERMVSDRLIDAIFLGRWFIFNKSSD